MPIQDRNRELADEIIDLELVIHAKALELKDLNRQHKEKMNSLAEAEDQDEPTTLANFGEHRQGKTTKGKDRKKKPPAKGQKKLEAKDQPPKPKKAKKGAKT